MTIEEEINEIKEMLTVLMGRMVSDSSSDEKYGDYLLRWFSLYKEPRNRSNTSMDMMKSIRRYILPEIGNVSLTDLSGDLLQATLNKIERSNTRNKVGLILHGSLDKAVKLRLIQHNPYDVVEIRRHRPVHYKPLNGEQQRDLLSLVDRDHYRAVMKVLICTGFRIGEFLALDFDEIDYDNRYIYVDKTVDVKTGERQPYPKTESSIRKVPFLPDLAKDLRAISDNVKMGQSFSYNAIKEYFQKRYQKMEIKRNIHSMRHTFVSMAYYVGVPMKTIQRIVGHATLDMTMNVYTHIINPDESPYVGYFVKLLEDVKMRPTDFWDIDTT